MDVSADYTVNSLVVISGIAATPVLVKALSRRKIWRRAIIGLQQLGSPIRSILMHLMLTESSLLGQNAATALGRIGGTPLANELIDVWHNQDLDGNARCRVVKTLGEIGDPCAVPTLITLLKELSDLIPKLSKKRQSLLTHTIKALGAIRQPAEVIIPALATLLQSDVPWVHKYAAGALKRIGVPNALRAFDENIDQISTSAIPELLKLMRAKRAMVGDNIATTLGKLGGSAIVPKLIAVINDANINHKDRCDVVQALGATGDKAVVPALIQLLTNESPSIPHLSRKNGTLVINLIRALGGIGEPVSDIIMAFEGILQYNVSWVRRYVEQAVSQMQSPEAERIIKERLTDRDVAV